jgi:type II secretory pathway component PulF
LYISTIKAGETSGALDEIFSRLADLGEHEADTKSKMKAATRYPIVAISVLVIGFAVLVTYVIPRFVSIFDRYEAELPLPTKVLIWINSAIVNYWHLTIVLIVLSIFAFRKFISLPYGRRIWDTLKLKVPVFGPLYFMITMSRFSRIMAIMIKSGVPILSILEMVSDAAGNVVIKNAIKDVMKSVNQGRGMAEPMSTSKVFSPLVVQMVSIGEETGQVDELLFRISEYYDQQSDYMIKNLTTMIEPILVVILGCVVLLMALAIFLPMWNMIGLFRR